MGFRTDTLPKKFRDKIANDEPVIVEAPELHEQTLALQSSSPVYKVVLPYPVSANIYWRTRVVVPSKGLSFPLSYQDFRDVVKRAFVSTYVSEEAKEFKQKVASIMLASGVPTLRGPVVTKIDVYRPRRVGNLDNRLKVLFDALNEFAYADDEQIVKIIAERFEDASNPRVEVFITERL